MNDGKGTFNVLESIEKHIEALKPLIPKQALVCIGEYPIKIILKEPTITKEVTLPVFIEKSSDEIYKWLPKAYDAQFVLGFEDKHIDTHFWYSVLPTISRDNSVLESLKIKSAEKLHGAIIFSSVWDGIGSASLPAFIGKFKAANIDSLSIAVLPSKIQPTDAHFNAYATLEMCLNADGATVLLIDRDLVEAYEGVDRKGELIKGNMVANYLLNLFLAKETLVEEIAELSRTFNTKIFTPIAITGSSYRIYGSLENMLNTALLKPFLKFDLSTASLLYVVLRMPLSLKDKLPRGKIELAITNWFKEKTVLQSIYITEPIYTQDMNDRIDAVLFVGGFNMSRMMSDLEAKVNSLKNLAVERGLMTEDWRVEFEIEEPPTPESLKIEELTTPLTIAEAPPTPPPTIEAPPSNVEEPKETSKQLVAEEPEIAVAPEVVLEDAEPAEPPASVVVDVPKIMEEPQVLSVPRHVTEEPKIIEEPQAPVESVQVAQEPKVAKPKRTRRTKKTVVKKITKNEKVDEQKE
jgi:hypothetical protein